MAPVQDADQFVVEAEECTGDATLPEETYTDGVNHGRIEPLARERVEQFMQHRFQWEYYGRGWLCSLCWTLEDGYYDQPGFRRPRRRGCMYCNGTSTVWVPVLRILAICGPRYLPFLIRLNRAMDHWRSRKRAVIEMYCNDRGLSDMYIYLDTILMNIICNM